MDPARPNDPDPADPFAPIHGDKPVIETIEIATEGEDCDECVRKLRPTLMAPGVLETVEKMLSEYRAGHRQEAVKR